MKLSFEVKKSINSVFDYLANTEQFVTVHPVITKIDKQSDNSYLVYETIKLGSVPFSFTYPVRIESWPGQNRIIMKAVVMRLIKIEMTFTLKESKDFTVVEESIDFRSVLPVRSMMQQIFRKQHQQLFTNIEMAN